MELIAVCYPELREKDHDFIQSIREKYDENYPMIGPHFTLIFPTSAIDRQQFVDHCRRVCNDFRPFSILIRCALVNKFTRGDKWFAFLVPDEGFSQIVKLHDRLYTGILADELILEIPYIPHITMAQSKEPGVCKKVTDEFNERNFQIGGTVTKLDLAIFEPGKVMTFEKVELG